MEPEEGDFGDNFFGEEDEAPVDMEAVREGMKLVPLSDVRFEENDDVCGVGTSIRDSFLSPLELILPGHIDFQETTNLNDGVLETEPTRKHNSAVGIGTRIMKHVETEIIEENDCAVVELSGPCLDFSLWTVEDDLLLKNAMEAGAAMEALAKGAFRFSRRYTVWQLRERWRALLYDPEISEQAAALMVKAESRAANLARLTCLDSLKDSEDLMRERKSNSIRTHYYKKRKRIVDEKSSNGCLQSHDAEGRELANVHEDTGFVYQKEPSMEDSTFTHMVSLLAAGGVGAVVGALPSAAPATSLECSSSFLGNFPQVVNDSHQIESLDGLCKPGFADNEKSQCHISADLVMGEASTSGNPLGNEGTVIVDEKQREKCANFTSLRTLGSPLTNFTAEELYQHRLGNKALDTLQQLHVVTDSEHKATGGVMLESELSESDFYSDEIDELATTACRPHTVALPSVVGMVCVLNTEDTNIPSPPPCSDRGILLAPLSPVYSPIGLDVDENDSNISGGVEEPDSLEVVQVTYESGLPIPEENLILFRVAGSCTKKTRIGLGQPLLDSHEAEGNHSLDAPGSISALQVNAAGLSFLKNEKGEPPEGMSVSRNFGMLSRVASYGNSCPEDLNRPVDYNQVQSVRAMTMQVEGVCQNDQGMASRDHTVDILDSKNNLQCNNEEFLESDEEMARFSDVEAMILDMDLDPGHDEMFSARAESRRFYKNHCKTIARLEQGANAALQRRLTRHGAVAILYGRHLRYFITRNEVTLGRVTQDISVDIDLGKEGRANKVSRLQANIKLKQDGVFYLKNLGRRAITVNSKSIETGQRAILGSNCLIEVGGMRFIFEINKKIVRQRVEQMIYARNLESIDF